MGRRTFAGLEVISVLVNVGRFEWRRTTGDHAQLYYEHPTNEDDRRQVTVPRHDELRVGTLRTIADDAGAEDFDAFCDTDYCSQLPVIADPVSGDDRQFVTIIRMSESTGTRNPVDGADEE